MARTELEKLMALLKTDASVDPKPVRTGATRVRNKSAKKLGFPAKGPNGEDFDTDDGYFDENNNYVAYDKNDHAELFDDNNNDSDDDATPLDYPEVVKDPPASGEEPKMLIGPDGDLYNPQDGFWENGRYYVRKDKARPPNARPKRPSSAPESSNARRHMHVGPDGQLYDDREWYWNNGRKYRVYSDRDPPRGSLPQRNPRSHTNRPRNGNTRPHTTGPRNRNAHKSGRFAENKTFDATKQYRLDVKSVIYDFNGQPIPPPVNKIIFNDKGEIELKRFDQRDLSRLVQRQIAMYLHDKNVAQKNAYVQKQLVGRYERRLRYVRPHLSKFRS